MKLTNIAHRYKVSPNSIRYWQKIGLLSDSIQEDKKSTQSKNLKNTHHNKVLNFEDLLKIRFIAACRKSGLSLQSIKNNITQNHLNNKKKDISQHSLWHRELFLYHSYLLLKKEDQNIYEPKTGQLFLDLKDPQIRNSNLSTMQVSTIQVSKTQDTNLTTLNTASAQKQENFPLIFQKFYNQKTKKEKKESDIEQLEQKYNQLLEENKDPIQCFSQLKNILRSILSLQHDKISTLLELGNLYHLNEKLDLSLKYYEKALDTRS